MKNIKLDKKDIIKFFLLSVFFLIIFYLFIFKNLIVYNEINDDIANENIKYEKLVLEREILLQATGEKEKQFNLLKKELEKLTVLNKKKENFYGISDVLSYINKNIRNNQLELVNFARTNQKNENINISLTLKGKEKNIKKFIYDIEVGEKNINLSENYFSFSVEKKYEKKYEVKNENRNKSENLVIVKLALTCILNKTKVSNIINEKIKNELFYTSSKDIFLNENLNKNEKNSLMRIGNRKFYKDFREEKIKIDKNKKILGDDKK